MKNIFTVFTVNTSLISLGFLLNIPPASAAYIYNILRIVPCTDGCEGNISVTGTITTDTLGQLSQENFIDWNLIFNSPDYTNIIRTPENSILITTRNPLVEATETELIYTAPFPDDFEETQQFQFRWTDEPMQDPPFVSWGFTGGKPTIPLTAEAINLSFTSGIPQPGDLGIHALPEGNGGQVILGTRAVPEPLFSLGTVTALGVGVLLKKQGKKH